MRKTMMPGTFIVPAQRMVVIHAWYSDRRSHHELYPVLALHLPADPEDLYDLEPIVCDSGQDVIGRADDVLEASNAASLAVVCPWPFEEDEERLKGWIEQTEEVARKRCVKE